MIVCNQKIPSNWVLTKVGNIISFEYGKSLPKRLRHNEGIYPVYGSNGQIGNHSEYLVEGSSIIVGRKGAAGEVHYVPHSCWAIDTTYFIKVPQGVSEKYMFHYLSYIQLEKLDKSTAIPGLNRNDAYQQDFPLPPLPEQHRIVAKIEELFSSLDDGVASLKKAQEQLKTHRQAVLKWAFEGRLTEEWRRDRISNEEVRMAAEKRISYKSDNYLPDGWEWLKLDDVCVKIGDIDHRMPKSAESGYPYIMTKNLTDDFKISFENVKFISEDDYLLLSRKIKPEKGDIIFPRYGTIGKNVFVNTDKQFLISYSCAILKPDTSIVSSKYIYLYTLSPKISKEIRKYIVETTQANIGISSIKQFVFPLTSIKEQTQIVQEIEYRLSLANKLEETIEQSLKQAEVFRQSILKNAFEGKLVQQDPDDESAEVLLERIKK